MLAIAWASSACLELEDGAEVDPEPADAFDPLALEVRQTLATLWEHAGYGGGALLVGGDVPNLIDAGFNDRISSLDVADGYAVSLYEHAFYQGVCQTFVGSAWQLPLGLLGNDAASSLRFVPLNICTMDADGCSTPTPSPYNGTFYGACVQHDHCYSTPGLEKSDCDSRFFFDLRDSCDWYRPDCAAAAGTYWLGVVAAPQAQDAYDYDQARVAGCDVVLDRGEVFYQGQSCY